MEFQCSSLQVKNTIKYIWYDLQQLSVPFFFVMYMFSGIQLWPIVFCTSNLPPHVRGNIQYLILAGMWLGCTKPDINVILKPVLSKLQNIKDNGIHRMVKRL